MSTASQRRRDERQFMELRRFADRTREAARQLLIVVDDPGTILPAWQMKRAAEAKALFAKAVGATRRPLEESISD